jgi:hypothetical protein
MYSYLDNVFPNFENTADTLYSKLYSSTNVNKIYNQKPFSVPETTNSFIPSGPNEGFTNEAPYKSNSYIPAGKSNVLIDVTKPYFKVPENEVGGYYNRVAVPNPTPVQQIEGFDTPNIPVCDEYQDHIMNCVSCRQAMSKKLGANSGTLELMSYIVFGVLLLLLMEKL